MLYFRDGRTILARVGTTDHSDVPLSAVPESRPAGDSGRRGPRLLRPRRRLGPRRPARRGGGRRRRPAGRVDDHPAVRPQRLPHPGRLRRAQGQGVRPRRTARAGALARTEILERYLNTIYFGRGAYGIAAAAHAYFGVTAGPADRRRRARCWPRWSRTRTTSTRPTTPRAARTRWNWIVQAEQERGWLEQQPSYPAVIPPSAKGPGSTGLIIDRVERRAGPAGHQLAGAAHPGPVGRHHARRDRPAGGERTGRRPSALASRKDLRAALVAVDPQTGGVRAYYGGNRGAATSTTPRPPTRPASTFKPIVLAAALGQGSATSLAGTAARRGCSRAGSACRCEPRRPCSARTARWRRRWSTR